ncbi:MAG: leucyl aminopeptidase [Planctomycetes bacterium]|nr:leucyl aminopeptidase [Planctomycetota bacterium]
MKLRLADAKAALRGDLVVLLCADGAAVKLPEPLRGLAAAAATAAPLPGKFRSHTLYHVGAFAGGGRGAPAQLLVVGLGDAAQLDTERLRRGAAVAQQRAAELGVAKFQLALSCDGLGRLGAEAAGTAVAEGLVLGAYRYAPPSGASPAPRHAQQAEVCAYGAARARADFAAGFAFGRIAAEATVFARDLENQPSNLCTPAALVKAARALAGGPIRVKVLDRRAMEQLGMGALLGVARGSAEPPYLIVLEHRVPKARGTVAVVGKGLTFDTGGISIKPAAKMDEMRYDMCGAGAVLGLFHALRHGALEGVSLRRSIVGVIAATENAIGPAAQKPGDVVRAMDGTTIEVLNTDAEGRLVLADAIAYVRRQHEPDAIVDLATLTGAVVVALGHEVAGIMGNDQPLVDALRAAGAAADEPLWQLPLWDCHKDQMKSRFADLANINGPQYGNGSIAGAAFLAHFAGTVPWAHLDIAGTAYGGLAKDYYQSGAAGTAVRTLLRWARTQ